MSAITLLLEDERTLNWDRKPGITGGAGYLLREFSPRQCLPSNALPRRSATNSL